jgi:hypothetical protein
VTVVSFQDPEDRSELSPIDASLGHGLDPTPPGAPGNTSATQECVGPVDHPLEREPERTGQVVSLAGDIVGSKALDFLVDHAEIASEGESLWADEDPDEDSTEAVSEPPEQDRAEERA